MNLRAFHHAFAATIASAVFLNGVTADTLVYEEAFAAAPSSKTDFNVQLGGDPDAKPGNTKIVSYGEWGLSSNGSFPDIGAANGGTLQPQMDTKTNARVAGIFLDPALFGTTGAGSYTLFFDVIAGSTPGAGRVYLGAGSGHDLSGATDAKLTLALAAPGMGIRKTTGEPAWNALTASGGATARHILSTTEEWILSDGTPTGEFREVPGIPLDVESTGTLSFEFNYDGFSTIAVAFAGYDTDYKIDNITILSPEGGVVWSGTIGTLPQEGMVLHLDANDVSGKGNGEALTEGWMDRSGAGNDALPGVPPTFLADAGGGYPAVRFNGNGQYLDVSLSTGTGASAFIVFANQRPSLLSDHRDSLLAAGSAATGLDLASSRAVSPAPDYPSFHAIEGAGVSVGTWVNGWNTADVSGDVFKGRFAIGSAVYTAIPAASTLRIGAGYNGFYGQNDIRELIIYNRALSDSERQVVEHYLSGKYDLKAVWRDPDHPVERYNMVLGSQQFGGGAEAYSFGESGIRAMDYARATLRQGARMIKLRLSNRYDNVDGFTSISTINSLVELVRDHPEVKAVLDLPVTDLLFWTSTFSVPKWQGRIDSNGLEPSARQDVYDEIYDLTEYLLNTYSGTGKNFFIGNWEGDWMLSGTNTYAPEEIPAERIQAMIDWANARQEAIDDAKAATPHSDVNVWFYLEMNKADWAREGRPCVLNSVIPAMPKLDFISISAYSMHKFNGDPAPEWRVHSDLDMIQAQLDAMPEPDIPGSRLIVGEYGYQFNDRYTGLADFAEAHITTARDILSWPNGTVRFLLQWQFFNPAERDDGESKEMNQIGEANDLRPLYYMHENFYRSMRRWVEYFYYMYGRLPTEREFADQAVVVLDGLDLTEYDPVLFFTTYDGWRDFHFPDAGDKVTPAVSGPDADPLGSGLTNLLRYALDMDLYLRRSDRMPHLRLSGGDPVYAIPFDPQKGDLVWTGQAGENLTQWPYEIFDSETTQLIPNNGWVEVAAPIEIDPGETVFYRLLLDLAP